MIAREFPVIAGIAVSAWAALAAHGVAEEPVDPARWSPRPWTRFLAEAFPEGIDPERAQEPLTIREPGHDVPGGPRQLVLISPAAP